MRATVHRHAQKAAPVQKVLSMSLLCHLTDSDRCRELFPTTSCKPFQNEICFPTFWASWGKEFVWDPSMGMWLCWGAQDGLETSRIHKAFLSTSTCKSSTHAHRQQKHICLLGTPPKHHSNTTT